MEDEVSTSSLRASKLRPITSTPQHKRGGLETSQTHPSLSRELDSLFDELLDQCRTSTPTKHRRARSLSTVVDMSSESLSSPRHAAVRMRSRGALQPSRSQPNSEAEAEAESGPESDKRRRQSKVPSSPSRPRHHPAADLAPFFPSGRSFEPLRAPKSRPKSTPPPMRGLHPITPKTPEGRVKTVVQEIERRVSCYGVNQGGRSQQLRTRPHPAARLHLLGVGSVSG